MVRGLEKLLNIVSSVATGRGAYFLIPFGVLPFSFSDDPVLFVLYVLHGQPLLSVH